MENLKVTRIADINIKETEVVELPGFDRLTTFNARLKRLSLLDLALGGEIPNELLGAVHKLYVNGVGGPGNLKDTAKTLTFIAKTALVEPSYAELQEKNIKLTDAQLLAIYLYATGGVKEFITFR